MNLSKNLRPVSTLAAAAIAAIILAGPAAPEARGSRGGSGSGTLTSTTNGAGDVLTTLYSFTNAANPAATLVQVGTNFYGTTMGFGTNVNGSVFAVAPNGKYTNVFVFQGTNNGAPSGPLVLDPSGIFYGTASMSVTNGFINNYGTIFSVSTNGQFATLDSFNGANGADPVGGLAAGANGYYYGVTSSGGDFGLGTVFAWSPATGVQTLFSFNGTNGSFPQAGLVSNWDGNFYGTTYEGGSNGVGTVFQFNPSPGGTVNSLASFTVANGAFPLGLIPVNSNLVGTTTDGGNNNYGAVFSVTTSGTIGLVASFDVNNGSNPNGPLLLGADGFLYGTTVQGGPYGLGVLFKVSTNATGGTNGVTWTNSTTYGAGGGLVTNVSTLSNVFAFNGTDGAYPMAGLILGSDFQLYGTTASGSSSGYGSVFKLSLPLSITRQPANVTFSYGSNAVFSIQATGSAGGGSAGASYQWQWVTNNGAGYSNVTNGAAFSGATTGTLTVKDEVISDAGSYLVIVSNASGVVTSSVATLMIPPPSISITAPATTTNNTLTVTGTATIKGGGPTDSVTNVQFRINEGPWTSAYPAVINNYALWKTPTATLTAGSNTIMAYAVDSLGNDSPTNSVTVFYSTDSTLKLLGSGSGTIRSNFTTGSLVVGKFYTVTASPSSGNLFANWTGTWAGTNSIVASTATLKFQMESNLTLTATFVPNLFLTNKGTFNGLFSATNGVAYGSAGRLQNLAVAASGAYSGRLYLGATNYTVAGSFNAYGWATNQFTNTTTHTPVTLVMNMNFITPPVVTGSVQQTGNGAFKATNLFVELAATNVATAEYTVLIPPGTSNMPSGFGYLFITIVTNHLGTATVTGGLADGTAFSESATISGTSNLAIYATPYPNGVLQGLLSLTNGLVQSNLVWTRPAAAKSLFTNGFTNLSVPAQIELWTNPLAKTPALQCPAGQLNLSKGATNLVFYVEVSSNNTLVKLGGATNSLTGSIAAKTGLLSVTIGNGNGKPATTGQGFVLQKTNSVAGVSNSVVGFFTNAAGAGLITLHTNLTGVAPIIVQQPQPASRNYVSNASVEFSVQAIGSLPLSYQWRLDGANLTNGAQVNGGLISGATNSSLMVTNERIFNAGSYSVIVANSVSNITSSNAILAVTAPTLAITPKPSRATTTNPLTVQGTASDKYGLGGVLWQVNSNGWTAASTSDNGTKWITTNVPLHPGTNTFQAYSVDLVGNHSATSTVTTFYVTYSTLDLLTNIYGTIKPGFAGKPTPYPPYGVSYSNLVVGSNYTVTAVPSSTTLFSNWTSTASLPVTNTTNQLLKFTMASNMTLTANFVTNFFIPARGIYNGLFYNTNTNGIAWETSGMLYNLSLKTNGAYSGKLYIAGTNYPLAGSFNLSGSSVAGVGPTNTSNGQLRVELTLDKALTNRITGTVYNTRWTNQLFALASNNVLSSNEYTVLLTNTTANTPPGDGYALVTNHADSYTFSGALADGTAFSQTVPASQSGDLPIYASLYGNTGLLLGWINMTNGDSLAARNVLTWIRKASGSAAVYPGGFTNSLVAQSSPWTNLALIPHALSVSNVVAITFPFVVTNLDFNVEVAETNTFGGTNSLNLDSLHGSIANKTGRLVVTFVNVNGTSNTGVGAILQNTGVGGGFFTNSTGSFSLTPNP